MLWLEPHASIYCLLLLPATGWHSYAAHRTHTWHTWLGTVPHCRGTIAQCPLTIRSSRRRFAARAASRRGLTQVLGLMKQQVSRWPVPIASLSSAAILAITLLHYIQAHRLGVPGGYAPTLLGATASGAIAGACSYFVVPPSQRSGISASLIGAAVALAFACLLVVTLVSGFGS